MAAETDNEKVFTICMMIIAGAVFYVPLPRPVFLTLFLCVVLFFSKKKLSQNKTSLYAARSVHTVVSTKRKTCLSLQTSY